MGETSVESWTGAVEDQKAGTWAATKKAISSIVAALSVHARSEAATTCSVKGSLSQDVNIYSTSNAAQPTSSVASKTGSTASQSTKALQMKEKLVKIHSNQAACGRDLSDEPYYHGYMTGMEAQELLGDVDGTFVVHKMIVKNKPEIIVSVVWNGCARHLRVKKTKHGNNVWLHKYCFKVELLDKIGEYDSGEFYRGKLTRGGFNRPITVAVKTIRGKSIDSDSRIKFLRESNKMLDLKHKNVIRFYGVCAQKDPIMIVREYAPGGSLLSRVRDTELELSSDEKARYCRHIAAGMQYLHDEKIIHRELSAKNCLLGKHDTAKVLYFGFSTLFGMQRDTYFRRTPVRWLAPETLQFGVYDWRTDIWSYGVLMWEVYSGGKRPYEEIKNNALLRQKILMEGLRLTPPEGMPPEMVDLMMQCFANERMRPHFFEISSRLSKKAALFHHLRCHVSKNFSLLRSHLEKAPATNNQTGVEI